MSSLLVAAVNICVCVELTVFMWPFAWVRFLRWSHFVSDEDGSHQHDDRPLWPSFFFIINMCYLISVDISVKTLKIELFDCVFPTRTELRSRTWWHNPSTLVNILKIEPQVTLAWYKLQSKSLSDNRTCCMRTMFRRTYVTYDLKYMKVDEHLCTPTWETTDCTKKKKITTRCCRKWVRINCEQNRQN